MPDIDATQAVAAAATATPVEGKPADAVADAAKTVAESTPKEESTLLGEEGKKDGVAVTPEVKAVVPEKYEIKAPEGMAVDADTLTAMTPIFKELGLSQEGAQKLHDAYAPQISRMMEAQRTAAVTEFQNQIGEWKSQTVNELGPEYVKELAHAGRFIDKFGGTELRALLDAKQTGLGNHPVLVKAFIAAGKAMANDSFPDSGKKGPINNTDEAKAATLFPSMKQN